jgi:HEAT repeat protein
MRFVLLLSLVALSSGLDVRAGAAKLESLSADEELLKSAAVGTDGTALLAFFRARTPNPINQAQVKALIPDLGNGSAPVRVKARAGLLALGRVALPLLKKAAAGSDGRVKAEAGHLVRLLLKSDPAVPAAAARLLALRKPPDAVMVLLAYAPSADDSAVTDEIRLTLAVLADAQGRTDPVLLAGLSDRDPIRRAIAAEALCRAQLTEPRTAVRKLLADPEPSVRLRVALALAATDDGAAIPVLIALLEELPAGQGRQAYDVLAQLASPLAPLVPLAADAVGRRQCRAAWEAWWRKYDHARLLEYFRKRTVTESGEEVIRSLIHRLGHSSFRVRAKASADLIFLKRLALPFLKEAAKDPDPEVRARAEACLTRIEATPEAAQSAAHIRLLVLRKPPEAAQVLLDFLPFADDESVVAELHDALASLASANGKTNQSLLAALDDKRPWRRQAAAKALCHGRARDAFPSVSKLLGDEVPEVRLGVSVALAGRGVKSAFPVLIDLLGELPQSQTWLAEESLRLIAGSTAPPFILGEDPTRQRKCRDAWRAWWQENQDSLELGRHGGRRPLLGYTLVAQWGLQGQVNELIELGPDRKPRWRIGGLGYSFDFEVLPGNRLLIPEHIGHRVTERDFRGKILWEYKIPSPVNCQRLPNGNTFISSTLYVVEVDRAKKEVLKINASHIMAAGKSPEGQIVILTSAGRCIRYDAQGKELKSFSIGGPMNNSGGLEVLPHGRVIVSSYHTNKVVEYDGDGKAVWTHAIPQPGFAARLANGNTLITSQGAMYAVEVTRTGKVVWEYRPGQAIWRARRR